MPRTKQKRAKGTSSSARCEQMVREFNRLAQLNIHKLELEHKSLLQKIDLCFEMALNRYPTDVQNLTLRELLLPDRPSSPPRKILPPKTPRSVASGSSSRTSSRIRPAPASVRKPPAKRTKRTTTTSDDGYQSESTASQASKAAMTTAAAGTAKVATRTRSSSREPSRDRQSSASRDRPTTTTTTTTAVPATARTTARTRSSSREPSRDRQRSVSRDRQNRLTATAQKKMDRDMLRTPACRTQNSFVITPKIKFNSACNVLRKPKDGEMVFSTQGSPLLVSTTVNERTANINVPLGNGDIVSLLPFNETSLTDNLTLDDETKHQLKILQSHLAKVLR